MEQDNNLSPNRSSESEEMRSASTLLSLTPPNKKVLKRSESKEIFSPIQQSNSQNLSQLSDLGDINNTPDLDGL